MEARESTRATWHEKIHINICVYLCQRLCMELQILTNSFNKNIIILILQMVYVEKYNDSSPVNNVVELLDAVDDQVAISKLKINSPLLQEVTIMD